MNKPSNWQAEEASELLCERCQVRWTDAEIETDQYAADSIDTEGSKR